MDLKQIQDLVKMVNKSNISELTIEENEFKITIKQKEDKYITAPMQVPQQVVRLHRKGGRGRPQGHPKRHLEHAARAQRGHQRRHGQFRRRWRLARSHRQVSRIPRVALMFTVNI